MYVFANISMDCLDMCTRMNEWRCCTPYILKSNILFTLSLSFSHFELPFFVFRFNGPHACCAIVFLTLAGTLIVCPCSNLPCDVCWYAHVDLCFFVCEVLLYTRNTYLLQFSLRCVHTSQHVGFVDKCTLNAVEGLDIHVCINGGHFSITVCPMMFPLYVDVFKVQKYRYGLQNAGFLEILFIWLLHEQPQVPLHSTLCLLFLPRHWIFCLQALSTFPCAEQFVLNWTKSRYSSSQKLLHHPT